MNQPLDLDPIEARANAATPGPWGFYDGDNYADVAADLQQTSPGSYSYREKVARLEDENYWDDPAHEDDDEERAPEQMAANAAFIAHARQDVPALLAEVRRLRGELADFSGRVNELESKLCDCEPVREHDDYKRPAFYQHEAHCPVTELTTAPAAAVPAVPTTTKDGAQ